MNKNFVENLPERFTKNILDLCGDAGKKWLDDLPRIVGELSAKWSLTVKQHFPNLSYNFVAPGVFPDGREAVLKIALPLNNPEIFNEADFLKISDGNGMVKLLNFDKKNRAMLLEKLEPGRNLKEIYAKHPSKTVEIMINILRRIIKNPPPGTSFLRLEDWFNGFERAANTSFPREKISQASGIFKELSSVSAQKFLIHGDLHHENILSAHREPFLAIDPKGIIGNTGYEASVFLNNHLWWLDGQPNLKEELNFAVRRFSEALDTSQTDLRKWALAQIVLSAWWTYEDNGDSWERELDYAEFWEV